MNEIYNYKREDTGFIHMNLGMYTDFDSRKYPKPEDILLMNLYEYQKLEYLDFKIIVIQYFAFFFCITEELMRKKKIVFVVHSVPTPDLPSSYDSFGGDNGDWEKFEKICNCASIIICVSEAEREKLAGLYPQYKDKIRAIHNGITMEKEPKANTNYKKSRRIFGFIGRLDYKKGVLECIKEFKDIDGELRLACPNNDRGYLNEILTYIKALGMSDKVKFYGWCVGARKENFLNSLDALIIPSLYEAFGYTAIEGMQYGLPLISSNSGGLNEILEGYKYKYPPNQEGALETQLKEFINAPNEEIEEQQQILMKNLNQFKAEYMAEKYHKIWDELLTAAY